MKKKLIIIGNISSSTRVFRAELLESLVQTYSVWLIAQFTLNDLAFFTDMGVNCIDLPIDRRGKNPLKDAVLLVEYFHYIRAIKPDLVLTFTIKPNIYAGLVCRLLKIKYIVTVEGLGTIFNTDFSLIGRCIKKLYGYGIRKAVAVFYLNNYIRNVLFKLQIKEKQLKFTPGMGVNLNKFIPQTYPQDHPFRILTIGRIMKEKGISEILTASDKLIKKIPDLEWYICGEPEKGEAFWLEEIENRPWVKYCGLVRDTATMYALANVVVIASYHEGLSTVCLESGASGRPIIGSDIYGIRETIDCGITGFLVKPKNIVDLVEKIDLFYRLPRDKKLNMGQASYRKIVKEFDRDTVVLKYEELIRKVI